MPNVLGALFAMGLMFGLCVGSVGAQEVSLLPRSLSFPSQTVGTTSSGQIITLTNTDDSNALTISSIVASGDFTDTDTCNSGVMPGNSCTISVQFKPTTTGVVDGSISIFDNAPGSPQIFGLTGTGIAQQTVSPSSLSFGAIAIGKTTPVKAVTLTNNTNFSITITGITVSGDFSAVPATTGGCGASLAGNSSCTMDVFFTPTELGAIDGSLTFADAGTQQSVPITGKGTGTANSPITLSTTLLAFGNQTVGTTSAEQPVTITNTGTTSLAITIAASSGYLESNPATGGCGSSLGGGDTCTIELQFAPAVLGAIDGSISISYSGANSPQVVSLTGAGIGQVTVSPTSLAFVPQQVGTTSAAEKVTVTNNSGSTVSVSKITPSGDFTETDTCSSIAAGKSCTIGVSYAPTEAGPTLGSIVITDSATNSPQIVDLSASSFLETRFAYVPNSGSDTVSIYSVNLKTGQLRSNGYTVTGLFPGSLTVDPSGRFAYLANYSANSVSAYTITAQTGQMTPVSGSPYPTGTGPISVTVDPSDQFVYVMNSLSANISAFTLDGASGSLTSVTGSPFASGDGASSMAIDPSGSFAYVNNENASPGGDISAYTIDASTGALTTVAGSPFLLRSGAFGIAVAPSGKFGYVLGEPGSGQITAFSINPTTGAPTEVAGSPFTIGGTGYALVMAPSGKFIYAVGNNNPGTIVALSVNITTGAVTPVSGSPFATGSGPVAATVDASGKLLYVANQLSNEIWTYTVGGNGALGLLSKARTQQAPLTVALGGGSTAVSYTPKFAYIANQGSSTVASSVSAFTINPSNGHLATVSGSPFADGASGTNASSVAVDPWTRFAYVSNQGTNTVAAYTIDSSTGILTPIVGSPFPAGPGPTAVTVDPSGRFAYVANAGSGSPNVPSVSAYTINASTGALTAISGSPFATGGSNTTSVSVTVDPTGQFVYVASTSLVGGSGNIAVLAINADTGALSTVSGSPFSTGLNFPASVAVDPSGRFAFATNLQMINSAYVMSSFSIDAATGAPTFLSYSSSLGAGTNGLATDSLGQFVYATQPAVNDVAGLGSDSMTGALTVLTDSPFPAETGPLSISIDPSGKFAYVANNTGNTVTAYSVNATTGDLDVIGGELGVATGTGPVSVVTTGTTH
jgi:6-phosphogluconolactonase